MGCGPELQYITGQVFDVFVATEAQRLERGDWESRASKAYAECGVVSDGPGRTPVLGDVRVRKREGPRNVGLGGPAQSRHDEPIHRRHLRSRPRLTRRLPSGIPVSGFLSRFKSAFVTVGGLLS